MKWIIFFSSVTAAIPAGYWIRLNVKIERFCCVLLGFLPFIVLSVPQLDIALIDWATWPGFSKGIIFSAVDILAISLIIGTKENIKINIPFYYIGMFYMLAVLISLFSAKLTEPAIFYAWQIGRLALLFIAVFRTCHSERNLNAIFFGLSLGVILQLTIVLNQRFVYGESSPSGAFGHRNQLGLAVNMIAMPLIALFLTMRSKIYGLATFAAIIIAVLTTSRATLALAFVGFSLIYLSSLYIAYSNRKLMIGIVIAIISISTGSIAITSYENRFPDASQAFHIDQERQAFNEAALLMSKNNPLGIGPNNFVSVANSEGYYDLAGVAPRRESRATMVHNLYWLTLAEMGYLGLISLVVFFVGSITRTAISGWKHRSHERALLLWGVSVGILVTAIHSFVEWGLYIYYVQSLFIILIGVSSRIIAKFNSIDFQCR